MSVYFKVIQNSNRQAEIKLDFLIKYGVVEWLYLPIILFLIFVGVSIVLVVGVSNNELSVLNKFLLVGASIVPPAIVFKYVLNQGRMVLGADCEAIYYCPRYEKDKLARIDWNAVEDISIYDDGARNLEIKTNIGASLGIPKPCNGISSIESNRYILTFYPRSIKSTQGILDSLNKYKQSAVKLR